MMTFLAERGSAEPAHPRHRGAGYRPALLLHRLRLPRQEAPAEHPEDSGGAPRRDRGRPGAGGRRRRPRPHRTLEEYKAQLAEARHEAARITEQAREQGAVIIAEMREEGQRQRDAIIAAGHAQIEADRRPGDRRAAPGRRASSPPTWPASSSASPSRTTPGRAASSTASSTSSTAAKAGGRREGAAHVSDAAQALAAARERLDALTDNASVDAADARRRAGRGHRAAPPRGVAAPGPDRPGAVRRGQGRSWSSGC